MIITRSTNFYDPEHKGIYHYVTYGDTKTTLIQNVKLFLVYPGEDFSQIVTIHDIPSLVYDIILADIEDLFT